MVRAQKLRQVGGGGGGGGGGCGRRSMFGLCYRRRRGLRCLFDGDDERLWVLQFMLLLLEDFELFVDDNCKGEEEEEDDYGGADA